MVACGHRYSWVIIALQLLVGAQELLERHDTHLRLANAVQVQDEAGIRLAMEEAGNWALTE